MNFKKWVKSIQTAGYNGARTVISISSIWSTELHSYKIYIYECKSTSFATWSKIYFDVDYDFQG